jgi:cell pole-organizing protein PopZ
MSAIDTFKTGSGSTEPRVYEPSMEEILASIRRIIADDQSLPGRALQREGEANLRAALDGAQPKQDGSTDGPANGALSQERPVFLRGTSDSAAVLYRHPAAQALQQAAEVKAELATLASRIVPAAGVQGRIAAPQFAMPDTPAPRTAEPQTDAPAPRPVSDVLETARAPSPPSEGPRTAAQKVPAAEDLSNLFSEMTSKAVAEAFNQLAASRLIENDEAVKDIVRDMLRPMLKSWLDDNLPSMVDRLVRAEIERVARGAR